MQRIAFRSCPITPFPEPIGEVALSNLESSPREAVCASDPKYGSFADGLRDGVTKHECGSGVVEILEPRAVPLGGPRAMTVQRSLPQRSRSLIGAWCFVDSFGPDDVAVTGGMKVSRHPHTGLATVSWLFDGAIDHVDSAGNSAAVLPGEVNLMNAGRGITHSEFSTAETTALHGVQLWYAFPDEARFSEPGLESFHPEPVEGDGFRARVFLGSLLGRTSPVSTFIPLTGAEIRLEPYARVRIPVPADHEHGVLQVVGPPLVDGVEIPHGGIGYVAAGRSSVEVSAGASPATILFLGGEPLREQIVMWWNFVGRSHEEIAEWRARYMAEMGFDSVEETDAGPRVDREERQFGSFPPNTPAPIPAPALPHARLKLRG